MWEEGYHRAEYQRLRPDSKPLKQTTHFYKDGDFCEEINANRKVQVRMACTNQLTGGQVSLALAEKATCEYVLTVKSPLFCELLKTTDSEGVPTLFS